MSEHHTDFLKFAGRDKTSDEILDLIHGMIENIGRDIEKTRIKCDRNMDQLREVMEGLADIEKREEISF